MSTIVFRDYIVLSEYSVPNFTRMLSVLIGVKTSFVEEPLTPAQVAKRVRQRLGGGGADVSDGQHAWSNAS